MAVPALTANSPSNGYIAWAGFNISYNGASYTVASGSTSNIYTVWLYNNGAPQMAYTDVTPLQSAANGTPGAGWATNPIVGPDDLVLFHNRAGVPTNIQSAQMVDGDMIVAGTITANAIAANTITGNKIFGGTITGDKIAGTTITGANIQGTTITGDKIQGGTITGDKIQAGSITTSNLTVGGLGDNRVLNPAFEDLNTAGTFAANWVTGSTTGSPTIALAATPLSGSHSMAITNSTTNGGGLNSTPFPVAVGETLVVQALAKSSVANAGSVTVRIWFGTTAAMTSSSGLITGTPAASTNGDITNVNTGTSATPATGTGVAYTDVAAGFVPGTTDTFRISGQVVVPTGATWAILALRNWTGTAATVTFDSTLVAPVVIAARIANGAITAAKISAGAITGNTITGGTITGVAYNNGGGTFSVDTAGNLTATSANITGTVTANSGTFTGTVNANAGTFSGTVNVTGTLSGGTISGATFVGGTVETGTSGNYISMSGASADRIIFHTTLDATWSSPYIQTSTSAGIPSLSIIGTHVVGGGPSIALYGGGSGESGVSISGGNAGVTLGGTTYFGTVGVLSSAGDVSCGALHSDCVGSSTLDPLVPGFLGTAGTATYFRPQWSGAVTLATGGSFFVTYLAGTVANEFQVGARVNAGTKSFVIDHPEKADNYLVHACVEGPENAVFYRGRAQLKDGVAIVILPDYFTALCDESTATVQITPLAETVHDHHRHVRKGYRAGHPDDPCTVSGQPVPHHEHCHAHTEVPNLVTSPVRNGRFKVGRAGGFAHDDTETAEFYWHVYATRRDVPPLVTEPRRADVDLLGDGPYTYLREKAA